MFAESTHTTRVAAVVNHKLYAACVYVKVREQKLLPPLAGRSVGRASADGDVEKVVRGQLTGKLKFDQARLFLSRISLSVRFHVRGACVAE